MKKIKLLILILLLFLPFSIKAKTNDVNLYLFYSESCSNCHAEIEFLETIKPNYPNLHVYKYEVIYNKDNSDLLNKVKNKLQAETNHVPFTVIGTYRYVGFNDNVKNQIKETIEKLEKEDHRDIVNEVINNVNNDIPIENEDQTKDFVVPILGKIDPKLISLPLLATVIGFIDGFNPCAMWILIFLISMLFNMKNKKRMWILGITFLVSSAFIYLLFMVAWLNLAISMTSILWIRILIAFIALIGGSINLINYFKTIKKDVGCTVVDETKRKKIFSKIKKITVQNNFFLAFIGIIMLAVSVNIIELACSAGLPLIFTQILAINDLTTFQYWMNISIYILFFLIDDIVIFVIAMVSLNITAISTKYSKYSHLIGGIIMLLIGILMIFKPEWLMFSFK